MSFANASVTTHRIDGYKITTSVQEVYLATPIHTDRDKEFLNAIYAPGLPYRSVCLRPDLYKEMRRDQILLYQVEENCKQTLQEVSMEKRSRIKDHLPYVLGSLLVGVLIGSQL